MVIKTATAARELWPIIRIEPLVVFAITLGGLESEENPGHTVYSQLVGYMKGNVALVPLDFSFDTEEGVESYSRRLNTVLDILENGSLQE